MSISSVNHIKENLHKLKTNTGKLSPTRINSKENMLLKQLIIKLTSFLPKDRSISERIYCILNNITTTPICSTTGVFLKWSSTKQCYNQTKTQAYKNRMHNVQPIQKRYQSIEFELNNKFNKGEFVYKQPLPHLDKFKTNIKHWDIEKDYDLFCSVLTDTKFLPTESKWGERFYCIRNNINSRIKSVDGGYATYINSQQGYSKFSSKKNKHNYDINNILVEVSKKFTILTDVHNINEQKAVNIKCKTCGTVKNQLFICGFWQDICCKTCTGAGRSVGEDEIINFLSQYNLNIHKNKKVGGVEIDIMIPDKNIGIEYCGVLWHSIGLTYPSNVNNEAELKRKHNRKKDICTQQGINLITIFDTEWKNKKAIVQSIILSKLGLLQHKIYARKCNIIRLTKEQKKEFYELNHIQGNCQSYIDYGLVYNGMLCAAMSFSNRKINKNNDVELVRYCSIINTSVVGGFSKLLKFATKYIHTDIISYCDRRYSNGNAYIQNGFSLIKTSPPNYFYTRDCKILKSRLMFQKHKLKNFYSYNTNKTESIIMYEEGYRKIYDCGNFVFKYYQ